MARIGGVMGTTIRELRRDLDQDLMALDEYSNLQGNQPCKMKMVIIDE